MKIKIKLCKKRRFIRYLLNALKLKVVVDKKTVHVSVSLSELRGAVAFDVC